MTLYEPDRESVERIKAAMQTAVDTAVGRVPKNPDAAARFAIESELRQAIKMSLAVHHAAVWRSARLVASYQFAVQHSALATFWRFWDAAERAGGFKAERFPTPVTVTVKE